MEDAETIVREPSILDGLLPPEMATKAEDIGVKKANMGLRPMVGLALLAGAFIAFGAVFATTALTDTAGKVPWGWARVVGGVVFSLGLILLIVGGAELFTGNNLIAMAWASRRVTTAQLLRNWIVVYVGNFIGSIGVALLVFAGQQHEFCGGLVGKTALNIALAKVQLGFIQAVALGVLCNTLVCLAVWLTFSAKTTFGRIAAIIFPISAFVAAGFEHCVANMYFIPYALLVKAGASQEFWSKIGTNPADFDGLTWRGCLVDNLLPVTLGNIIGGTILVGAVYWVVYLRDARSTDRTKD